MAEVHVITALVRKRADLAGEIGAPHFIWRRWLSVFLSAFSI